MNKRQHYMDLFSICAVLFGGYVGPGFASGTQTVNYLLTRGPVGVFIGPIICTVLAFVFTYMLFTITRVYQPSTYREAYNAIYPSKGLGTFFGIFKEIQVVILVLIALSAQISTAALLLNTIYNVPVIIGSVGFIAVVLAFALFGAKLLRTAGSFLSIAIIVICVFIAARCLGAAWPGMTDFMNSGATWKDFGFNSTAYAWFSMLMLSVFFMNGYEACVPASKGIVTTKKDVLVISLGSALMSGVSTMVFCMIFAAGMPDIADEAIPTLWALTELTPSIGIINFIYVVFAIAAMLSTSMSLIFTVSERFEKPLGNVWKNSSAFVRKLCIAMFFVIICTLGSSVGLLNIIRYGYNMFTMIVGPVMLVPLIVAVPYRLSKRKAEGQSV